MSGGLFTDFYELTMAQGYLEYGLDRPAVFNLFFRRQPWGGGYSLFAGLDPLLEALQGFRFSGDDLEYLDGLGTFSDRFLHYLEGFSFKGDIYAFAEGDVIFPHEPLLRVHSSLVEGQLIEGLVLNTVNFQSLIATKAARISRAAKGGRIMEFGLRRAQGRDGALSAARAAYIGGAYGTSNVQAARNLGIPAMGTMAHSWVMAFPSEREAFDAYAELYPDKTIFLIDTYDTLGSGVRNAILAGKRLAERGKRFGVRLDSGDIQYLSAQVRKALDDAGLRDSFIVVSNELDETIIERLVAESSPIDVWGVGTSLVTGGCESSFTGVYKLAAVERGGRMDPTMKVSENPAKSTDPGIKDVWRLHDDDGPIADVMTLSDEALASGVEQTFYHPSLDTRRFTMTPDGNAVSMLSKVMEGGLRLAPPAVLDAIRERAASALARFDSTYLRLLNPHLYRVSITENLRALKLRLSEETKKAM
ncbi:MAG: nicotinate phosphoribosyltransferase [Spirochaetes bacterium]|nr:nicotinate phosphoribosyltransferase [Spirochaetota bacterium]